MAKQKIKPLKRKSCVHCGADMSLGFDYDGKRVYFCHNNNPLPKSDIPKCHAQVIAVDPKVHLTAREIATETPRGWGSDFYKKKQAKLKRMNASIAEFVKEQMLFLSTSEKEALRQTQDILQKFGESAKLVKDISKEREDEGNTVVVAEKANKEIPE